MKNFFKKLSFVLAVAMVLTSIAPASASAAAKNYIYKSGKDSALTSVNVWFGDDDTDLNVKINGKKNVAGTWKAGNKKVATVDKNGVITPVANGTTTIKFTAKTGETASVKVTVGTRVKTVKPYLPTDADKKAVTELAMNIGDEQQVYVGLGVSAKAKAAGSNKTSMKTAAKVDGTAVEVVKDSNQKYTVKAVEAGEATITIGAHKASSLAAGKYFKKAEIKVTVADKLAAKQTGANKITVTGTNLTDAVADYTVKRGNVTVSFKTATVSEDKTSVVLEAAASVLPKGNYTLSFKDSEAVEFEVVDAVVSKIVIEPEYAIMATSKSAVAYVTIYNQFDEDVTTAQKDNVQVSGSDNAAYDAQDAHKIVFNASNAYTMNLSQVSVALVCKTNGVNVSKILTVVEEPKLDTAEFKGIYKLNARTGVYEAATLSEGADLSQYRLVFKTMDQYGFSYANAAAISKLQVNLSSATGLQAATGAAFTANELGDHTNYVAFELGLTTGFSTLGNGDVTLLGVLLTNGKTVSETFTVAAGQKIASITVSAPNGVYGNQENTLDFVALDQNGNEIKDYATMSRMNNTTRMPAYQASGTGLRFVPNADGSAKLVYEAATNTNSIATPVIVTFLTETNAFTTADLSVQPNCVPKAIIGIDSWKAVGVTSGGSIILTDADFIFQDQYGNVMADNHKALTGVTVTAIDVNGNKDSVFTTTTFATSSALTNANDTIISVTATTYGAVTVKVALEGVSASDYTFTLYNVDVENISSFAIEDLDPVNVSGATTKASISPSVYGYYAGKKIALQTSDYKIVAGGTVYQAAFGDTSDVKEETVAVVINNAAGTEVTKTYKYSNIKPYVASVKMSYLYAGNITVSSNTAISAASLSAINTVLEIKDQYNANYTGAPRVTISNYGDIASIDSNATDSLTFKYATPGYRTIHVKYTWDNGYTFETDLVINVQ